MIIKCGVDAWTQEAVDVLAKLYTNENVISPKNLFSAPKEKDGSVPKRISFYGHGSRRTYGTSTMSADKFAQFLINALVGYANKDPSIKNSLECIDLFGCNIGHVKNGSCFALEVASKVNQELKNKDLKRSELMH